MPIIIDYIQIIPVTLDVFEYALDDAVVNYRRRISGHVIAYVMGRQLSLPRATLTIYMPKANDDDDDDDDSNNNNNNNNNRNITHKESSTS
jgi:hypothetical protein